MAGTRRHAQQRGQTRESRPGAFPRCLTTTALLGASALFCAVAVHAFDTGNHALIMACAAALGGALLLLLSYERLAVLAIVPHPAGESPLATTSPKR